MEVRRYIIQTFVRRGFYLVAMLGDAVYAIARSTLFLPNRVKSMFDFRWKE